MMNIKITDKAAAQINALIASDSKPVRLSIKSTGCSGNSYKMEYVEELSEQDDLIEDNGASLCVPKIYSWMLIGTTIDYITDELGNSRFEFINPNETARCGCGESFHVERPADS